MWECSLAHLSASRFAVGEVVDVAEWHECAVVGRLAPCCCHLLVGSGARESVVRSLDGVCVSSRVSPFDALHGSVNGLYEQCVFVHAVVLRWASFVVRVRG